MLLLSSGIFCIRYYTKASRGNNLVPLKILLEEIEGTELANEPIFKKFKEENPPGWEGSI